jgi:hypothetical protein
MTDAKTLTAEEIDERAQAVLWWVNNALGQPPAWSPSGSLDALAAQAKRVPELEAELAACRLAHLQDVAALEEKRDRYRKVAELALEYRRRSDEIERWPNEVPLDAALAAVGMKVEE